jgi:hypothetical protein
MEPAPVGTVENSKENEVIGKIFVGAVIVGTGVVVGVKLAQKHGLKGKVEGAAAVLLDKANDLLIQYDDWTRKVVGEQEGASQNFHDASVHSHDAWETATHDEQGAGTR